MAVKQLQFLVLVFYLSVFSATSLNFTLPRFPSNASNVISVEGDAFFDGSLRLTKSARDARLDGNVGRATYMKPLLLRQNSTGNLADFTTTFTFTIDSENNTDYGDGMAFFLAPEGSKLDRAFDGSGLGLPVNSSLANYTMSSYKYLFVAVEFDIFNNSNRESIDWGLNSSHVGIDINSVKSNVTKTWDGGIMEGALNNATVSYNSSSKNLSVAFTTFELGVNRTKVQVIRNIHFIVDLLQYLPDTVIVGFSASTGMSVAMHKINSWNFNSTPLLDENSPAPPVDEKSSATNNIGLAVGLGVGGGCLILLGVLAFIFFRKKNETGENSDDGGDDDTRFLNDSIEEFEKGTGPRKFMYNELANATGQFSKEEKLGEGGFGGVYRGFIKDLNSYVAVKKISTRSKQGLKEYAAEVRIISRLRHRNLVQLIGWCHEKKLLLVYEFMPNGSLDSHLFKEESLLTWDARYNIAKGLASGLLYLHQEWEQCVLHRDIKSSNVMLDSNFNAKLGDFGLAKLVDHGKLSQTTVVAGTMGYMAMEYVTTGKASKESDVYSFGVVALEIACGRKSIDHKLEEEQINMVEWVWELYGEGRIVEATDPKLFGEFDKKQMECLMIVGLWCAHPDYKSRPLIQQAIQVLNFEVPLPNLPEKMPVAFAPLSFSMLCSGDTTGGQSESSRYGSSINSSQFTPSSTTNSNPSALLPLIKLN